MLILPADFPRLADRFAAAFRREVAAAPVEPAWYPGTRARYDAWLAAVRAAGARVETFDAAPRRAVGGLPGAEERLPFALADLGAVAAGGAARLDEAFPDTTWARVEPFAPVRGPRARLVPDALRTEGDSPSR